MIGRPVRQFCHAAEGEDATISPRAPRMGGVVGTAYGNTQSAAYAGPRQGEREVGMCALVLPSRSHSSQTALSGLYWDEKPY